MYTSQFGQNLSIGREDRVQTRHFQRAILPGWLWSQKSKLFIKVLQTMYLCQFGRSLAIGSEDKSADKAFSII